MQLINEMFNITNVIFMRAFNPFIEELAIDYAVFTNHTFVILPLANGWEEADFKSATVSNPFNMLKDF